jgi:hypothetical protein
MIAFILLVSLWLRPHPTVPNPKPVPVRKFNLCAARHAYYGGTVGQNVRALCWRGDHFVVYVVREQ